MKKLLVKKIIAGLCITTMLLSVSTNGVLAADITLDPSNESKKSGNTDVKATVEENSNKPDYIITIPESVDFGTLQQPETDADAYSTVDLKVTCSKADGLKAGQGIAVLVKDITAQTKDDPFKLINDKGNSLTYQLVNQNTDIQSGTWYTNGFMFITFTGAGQEHSNQLRLNRNQLYGKDISTWGGKYSGTLNFYTRIVDFSAQ